MALAAANSMILQDPCIIGKRRGAVIRALPKKNNLDRFQKGSYSFNLLLHEVNTLDAEYMNLWIDRIQNSDETKSVGQFSLDIDTSAQLIGSHLQMMGFSESWIVNKFSYELSRNKSSSSMAQILEEASRLGQDEGPWTVLIPLAKSARMDSRSGKPWLSRKDFSQRFAELFPSHEMPAHVGGFELTINAIDKYTVLETSQKRMAQIETRAGLASSKRRIMHQAVAWVSPGEFSASLPNERTRSFRIPSLDEDGGIELFDTLPSQIESAIDLLSDFQSGLDRSTCISSWAAVETLLAGREDFGQLAVVAERAADILTCRFIFDELNGLAVSHSRSSQDALAVNLKNLSANARAREIEDHLRTGGSLAITNALGQLAVERVTKLINDPNEVRSLKNSFMISLSRLYAARNSIVHAGELEPYGFGILLPSAEVLLGALLDTIVIASRRTQEPPGMVAAKANWALEQAIDLSDFSSLTRLW
ncbi:hypothetical protein [Streptomyces arenae]|uniref:hypothetical protein n=1 Tax=Streptomyces arenae TaxID=29301 RepID=UPI00265A5C45|nr:hypothetical protein [Streptomyces arenae]MCG7208151.1 hypothetical protein [Streptomyces arenae]